MLAALAVVATPVVCCALALRKRSERLAAIARGSLLADPAAGSVLAVLLRLTGASAAAGSGRLPTALGSSPFCTDRAGDQFADLRCSSWC